MTISVNDYLKNYLKKERKTLTEVVSLINKNRTDDKKTSLQNISNKLNKGTIKFSEILEIADVLGYDIVWIKRNSATTYNKEFYITDALSEANSSSTLDKNENLILLESIEKELKCFTHLIINIICTVEDKIINDTLKTQFYCLLSEKNTLSLQMIYLKYNTLFYRLMLTIKNGHDYIPTITYIRNIYLQGGFNTLTLEEKREFLELMKYFTRKSQGLIKEVSTDLMGM